MIQMQILYCRGEKACFCFSRVGKKEWERRRQCSTRRRTIRSKPEALTALTLSLTTAPSIEPGFAPPLASVTNLLSLFSYHPPLFLVIHSFAPLNFADDPSGDPKLIGDPYCTLFVGRLSHLTTEHTLRQEPFSTCSIIFDRNSI